MADPTDNPLRDFIVRDIDEHYLEPLRRYLIASGDRTSLIVDFSSALKSPFLQGSQFIGDDDTNYMIIDSFNAIRPVVLNYRFLVENRREFLFQPGIILDSHVVDYLHGFVTNEGFNARDTPRGRTTRLLLETVSQPSMRGWDFNPFFYMIESLGKGLYDRVLPHAAGYRESIFRIQTMDDDHFIRSGEIVPDPEKIEEHAIRHNSASFRTAAMMNLSDLRNSEIVSQTEIQISAIYATLLKIGLIHHRKTSTENKIVEIFDFFEFELARIIHEKCAIKVKPLISFTTMRMGCLMKFFAMKSLAQLFGGLGRFRAVR